MVYKTYQDSIYVKILQPLRCPKVQLCVFSYSPQPDASGKVAFRQRIAAGGLIGSLHTFLTGRIFILPAARFSLQQRRACESFSCNRTPMSRAFIFNNVHTGMLLVTAAERLHTKRELNASERDDK